MKLLFVDDDKQILDGCNIYFKNMGYQVFTSDNSEDALKILKENNIDCLILDVKLSDKNEGFSLCMKIKTYMKIPIIFISNYIDIKERIIGLSIGGDDFLCKPFSLKELELRIKLRVKQNTTVLETNLQFHDLVINMNSHIISYKENHLRLSSIEFAILFALASHPDQLITYEKLYREIYNEPMNKGKHSLQARVADLRKNLISLCEGYEYIETIQRVGYQFNSVPKISSK